MKIDKQDMNSAFDELLKSALEYVNEKEAVEAIEAPPMPDTLTAKIEKLITDGGEGIDLKGSARGASCEPQDDDKAKRSKTIKLFGKRFKPYEILSVAAMFIAICVVAFALYGPNNVNGTADGMAIAEAAVEGETSIAGRSVIEEDVAVEDEVDIGEETATRETVAAAMPRIVTEDAGSYSIGAEIADPRREASLEDIYDELGMKLWISEDGEIISSYIIADEVAEINYSEGETELCFRAANGSVGDISGVYADFDETKELMISGVEVSFSVRFDDENEAYEGGEISEAEDSDSYDALCRLPIAEASAATEALGGEAFSETEDISEALSDTEKSEIGLVVMRWESDGVTYSLYSEAISVETAFFEAEKLIAANKNAR